MDYPDVELSIALVDDSEIAEMNQHYRRKKGPTNVLSFCMRDGQFGDISPELLGDVVISLETAAKESQEMGISLVQRVEELLIHGILHLCGYDHELGEEKAAEMEAKTRQLLRLGLRAKYDL